MYQRHTAAEDSKQDLLFKFFYLIAIGLTSQFCRHS